ncbi:MAG TPA: hypothetical protein VIX86_11640 [Streptosporangiaceae bacterium]
MALDMNPEVRAQWCAALRSGEYQQGRAELRSADHKKHCCLGVLTDLAARAGVPVDWETAILPYLVTAWAGLTYGNPMLARGHLTATGANDDEKWTFAEIADDIDGGQS